MNNKQKIEAFSLFPSLLNRLLASYASILPGQLISSGIHKTRELFIWIVFV